jgi:hypothetical protein
MTASNVQTGVVVQAKDLIVVMYMCSGTVTPTCSDNAAGGTNIYSQAGIAQGSTDGLAGTITCFKANAKAGGTLTITCLTESVPVIIVHVYSGGVNDYAVDGTFGAYLDPSDTTTHPSTSRSTANAIDAIVCGWWASNTAESPTTSGGWTRQELENSAYGTTSASCDIITSSTGNYSNTIAGTASQQYLSLITAFNALSPPGTPGVNIPIYLKHGE